MQALATAQKKVQASSRRATTMLITVVVMFALSWLPFQALEVIAELQFNPFLQNSHESSFCRPVVWLL